MRKTAAAGRPTTCPVLAGDDAGIARAASLLRAGELVAFGTETVYGLGADATNPSAVAAVFEVKGRPRFNPLICHYASAKDAFSDVDPTGAARRLATAFWPGPLTLVLPRAADCTIAMLASAGLDTAAVRVPGHETARRLIATVGRPIAGPSANRSGRVSPTTAAHVLAELGGRIAAVLDTGPCPVGLESTVLELSAAGMTLLRPGGITSEALQRVIGCQAFSPPLGGEGGSEGDDLRLKLPPHLGRLPEAEERGPSRAWTVRAPGMLKSHYAPSLPVRLNAREVTIQEGLLAFGPALPGAAETYMLSAAGDLREAASRLFEGLRELDARRGLTGIAVMPIPCTGLGAAINDRLIRAAAPCEAAHRAGGHSVEQTLDLP